MPMSDAIENLAQDLSQNNTSVDAMYPLGYENYYVPRPDDFGVPQEPDQLGNQWKWDASNPAWGYYNYAQDLSNPSTLGTGGEMDYNVRDQPVERINDVNTDEKDAFVRTGIGTTLDPKTEDRGVSTGIGTTLDPMTEDRYRFTGLIPPDKAGTFIGVQSLTKDETEKLIAGQTPSLPQGVRSGGGTAGRTFDEITQKSDYSVPIGVMADTGDIIMANRNNIRDTIVVPSGRSISQDDIDRGVLPNVTIPTNWNKGINTELAPSQKTPTSVGADEGVGAAQPSTTSEGGFNNTGGNVTVGPRNLPAGPGDTATVTPEDPDTDFTPVDSGNEFWDSPWTIATPAGALERQLQQRGWKIDENGNYLIWVPFDKQMQETYHRYGQWRIGTDPRTETEGETETPAPPTPPTTNLPPGSGTTTNLPPGGGTTTNLPPGSGTTTNLPPGSGTTTNLPPSGGTTTNLPPGSGTTTNLPPGGGVQPPPYTGFTISTKETKEVPLPDRQADPFAQIYADLLANAQQQKDQYRYINYDPDQIMNAAMSGFRRRGAMRSLQGY